MMDLFTPRVASELLHPNFVRLVGEKDDAVRAVLRYWADGFVDRDGKFVDEFQRSFNSSWWELYLFAVLKSFGIAVDFSEPAPDFICPSSGLAIEATIASHAQGMTPEWEKTIEDLCGVDAIGGRCIETLARLSNSLDAKVRRYRDYYASLPHMKDLSYVIAIHNFGTPDAHQLGDVAMQRLLYDVWGEETFLKGGHLPLPTGLFLGDTMREVSAVIYNSLATFGKARALSASEGDFVFQATRIRNNAELITIGAPKVEYHETIRDGLRVFHNPNASQPLAERLFDVDDVRQFRMRDGEIETTCHPHGDLCTRQVHNLIMKTGP